MAKSQALEVSSGVYLATAFRPSVFLGFGFKMQVLTVPVYNKNYLYFGNWLFFIPLDQLGWKGRQNLLSFRPENICVGIKIVFVRN